MKRKIAMLVMMITAVSLTTLSYGTSWDAVSGWSDSSNPNGVWSYRVASSGNLMLQATGGTAGGGPAGWSIDGGNQNIPTLFDNAWSSVQQSNEFGGHGEWTVRWVSPITGTVRIRFSMLQLFTAERRMKARLMHGATTVAERNMPEDPNGNTIVAHPDGNPQGNGANRDGLVALGPFVRRVTAGDTIELKCLACGAGEGGNGVPTFCIASFYIEEGVLDGVGYVVVSPNGPTDGGDYGPSTPGTTTSGIQEAFDYASENKKEVFIIGGGQKSHSDPDVAPVVYNLSTTLNIPWGQDFHCDGGEAVLNFTQSSGDCMVIDSMMNCVLKFGGIKAASLTSGSVVRIKPNTAGPNSTTVWSNNKILINSIIGGGVLSGTYDGKGVGLHLDASLGPISYNDISVGEITACDQGILVDDLSSGTIAKNSIDCPWVYACDTLLRIETGDSNRYRVNMKPHASGSGVIGADIYDGDNSTYTLSWQGTFDAGNALKFGSGALNNLIYAMNLANNGITNSASNPTNRVVAPKSLGLNVTTPSVPASTVNQVNTTSYTVVVTMLTAGTSTNWTITDSAGTAQTVSTALRAGQSFYLQPGDKVKFTYTAAPTWKWRAVQ